MYGTRQYLFIFRRVRGLRKAIIGFVLSVCPTVRPHRTTGNTGRIFMKFVISVFFETL